MKNKLLIIGVIILISCTRKQVLKMDFEGNNYNKFEQSLLDHKYIIKNPAQGLNGGPAIQVNYIGSKIGTERVLNSMFLKEPLKEATLKYSVMFEKDFDFVKGGKLHGLGPDIPVEGGNQRRPDGWSLRILFEEHGVLSSYLYHQNNSGKYGDGIKTEGPVFTPGKYNEVSLYMKINEPASAKNGEFEIWVDGKKYISQSGIQFRALEGDSTLMTRFLFSTFHGGADPKYAPKDSLGNYRNLKAWFDDIKIYNGKRLPK